MKIVLQGYNTCCQNQYGGVQHRIRTLYERLNESGIHTEYFNQFSTILDKDTILHVFKLEPENWRLLQCAKGIGSRIVISTVVNMIDSLKVDIYKRILNPFPIFTAYKMMFRMLDMTDRIITETDAEIDFLVKHYGADKDKIITIPNGIDAPRDAGKEIFQELGQECKYVLVVGRFDQNKNQLSVIKALKGTGIDVVFIGGSSFRENEKAYYQRCLKEAEGCDSIHFLGWRDKDSPLLKSAYGNADVVVMPSFSETFGFALLEGGVAGAKLAASETLPILKYSSLSTCDRFNPHSIKNIREVVCDVFYKQKSNMLKDNILKDFSWDSVVDKHIQLYNELSIKSFE